MLQITRGCVLWNKREGNLLIFYDSDTCYIYTYTFQIVTFLVPLLTHEVICLHGEG